MSMLAYFVNERAVLCGSGSGRAVSYPLLIVAGSRNVAPDNERFFRGSCNASLCLYYSVTFFANMIASQKEAIPSY